MARLKRTKNTISFTDVDSTITISTHSLGSTNEYFKLEVLKRNSYNFGIYFRNNKEISDLVDLFAVKKYQRSISVRTPNELFNIIMNKTDDDIYKFSVDKVIIASSGRSKISISIKLTKDQIDEIYDLLYKSFYKA